MSRLTFESHVRAANSKLSDTVESVLSLVDFVLAATPRALVLQRDMITSKCY